MPAWHAPRRDRRALASSPDHLYASASRLSPTLHSFIHLTTIDTGTMFRWLVLALALATAALAHRIEIEQGARQCFFEDLQPQDRVRRGEGVAERRGEGRADGR